MADFTSNTNVNTSTLEWLVGKAVDVTVNASPLTMIFLGNQKQWKGSEMRFPVKYQSNSAGMAFDGLEKFNTTKQENFVNMEFSPTGREIPVVISQIEADVNASNPVVDLVARKLEADAIDFADDIAGKFYTAQTGKEFLSIIDAVDDGTNVSSYGGLSRSTYSGIQGNYTASVGTLTLSTMGTMYNSCTHGAEKPNLIVCSGAVWNYYEALLTPTVRTQVAATGYAQLTRMGVVPSAQALKGQQGFNAIFYRGTPVVADEKCGSTDMYFLNTKYIAFYGLKSTHPDYKPISFTSGKNVESVYDTAPKTTGFSFSGFKTPIDQYGRVGHIILMGNLICRAPRYQGRLTGITGS